MPSPPPDDPFAAAAALRASGVPFVMVTVVATRGSTPQDPGAKMIVTSDGLHAGTIGGGRVEAAALRDAEQMLAQSASPGTRLVEWNLQQDIGMTCGGTMQLFFERHAASAWTIAIFGAGHVVQHLIPVLLPLDARILCFDPRPEWINRLPAAPNLRAEVQPEPAEAVGTLPPGSSVLIITRGHAFDVPILAAALGRSDFPFVGVIGSAAKRAALERDLRTAGIPDERVKSFTCPLGLPIGTNHPQEIAISIAAGLLAARDSYQTG